MTAKEKILAGISEDAEKKAQAIIAEATKTAEVNTAAAVCEAEDQNKKIMADAEKKAQTIISNAESSAVLLKRDNVLKFKSQSIEDVLQAVTEKLNSYSDDEYFAFLYALVEKNAQSGSGVLFLNSKDNSRNTAAFKEKISALNLSLSEETKDIPGGFILQYNDILINCAIDALIHEKREKLIDVINRKLFA